MNTIDIIKLMLMLVVVDFIRLNYFSNSNEEPSLNEKIEEPVKIKKKQKEDAIKIVNEDGKDMKVSYEGDNTYSDNRVDSDHVNLKILYCSS